MMVRTPIVVGNWKLHKSIAEGLALVTELKNQLSSVRDVEIGVAPGFASLQSIAKRLEGGPIRVYGQNCHWEEKGAFTGEVGPAQLKDAGCYGVIIGHSERRQLFGETDERVAQKTRAALDAGLEVIVCVGETEAERERGETSSKIATQVATGLSRVKAEDLAHLVIAYEPVWAIGTGKTATPAQAEEVHVQIRKLLADRFKKAGEDVRIQYGGSVKADNAKALLGCANIDGALVGGASLQAADFAAIVKAGRVASGA
jgi:triosephosphate isomerase